MINEMKWGWFKVPLKVEQMNAYLFSDTISVSIERIVAEDKVEICRMNKCDKKHKGDDICKIDRL